MISATAEGIQTYDRLDHVGQRGFLRQSPDLCIEHYFVGTTDFSAQGIEEQLFEQAALKVVTAGEDLFEFSTR